MPDDHSSKERPLPIVQDLVARQDGDTPAVGEIKTIGRAYRESDVAMSLQPT